MSNYQRYKSAIEGQPLPLAFLDLDNFEKNAKDILMMAGNHPVRVVTKSIRSVDAIKHLLNFSDQFQGVMCYHPEEAVFLSEEGVRDILIAYPSMQSHGIHAVCQATKSGKQIVLMVDCNEHVELINKIAEKVGVTQPVCMDIDMSTGFPGLHFGVRRSPIRKSEQALALFEKIQQMSSVYLDGVMGYEAQIAGVGECIPGKGLQNAVVPQLKRLSIKQLTKRRQAIVNQLLTAGANLRFVNGGGTGSIVSTKEDASVTEIAVGSGFFCPHLFDYYTGFSLSPAAGFALEVARSSDEGYVTCSGGGYVASGSTGIEKAPLPFLPEGAKLDPNEGAGEVQTPLMLSAQSQILSLGDPVFFRHSKAGELCERFSELQLIRSGKLQGSYKTYRGQGKVFV